MSLATVRLSGAFTRIVLYPDEFFRSPHNAVCAVLASYNGLETRSPLLSSVDIVSDKTFLTLFEMPDLVHLVELVTESKGFLQLGSTPRSRQDALFWMVRAACQFGSQRSVDLSFHTGSTQRNFSLLAWR